MKQNIIDNVVRYFSPVSAAKRFGARLMIENLEKIRSFDGGSKSDRMGGWKSTGASADSALERNLSTLRNRSRDLSRNNVWAARALSIIVNNTIGTGIQGQITCANEQKTPVIEQKWKDWAGTTAIDADGIHDLIGLEALAVHTMVESGECIIRRRFRGKREKLSIPVQVQILEPDYLDDSRDTTFPGGGEIKKGIEYNSRGKRVAYWLHRQHPGDTSSFYQGYESVRIPAADIIHLYDPKRAGQSRGFPWISTAIRRLKDFDDYEDAQLVKQKISACFSMFIHDMNAGTSGATGMDVNSSSTDTFENDYLQPGIIETLPAGKQVSFANPPTVTGYSDYSKSMLLGVSSAMGITFESLTTDYSNVNFSSARMGHLEMSRNVTRWQSIVRVQMLERIRAWFMGGLTLTGIDNRDCGMKWIAPRREMIDPTKEVPATIKQIRAGLISHQRAIASMGGDYEEVMNEIQSNNQTLDDKNIILDSDPRRTNTSGSSNDKNEEQPPKKDDSD